MVVGAVLGDAQSAQRTGAEGTHSAGVVMCHGSIEGGDAAPMKERDRWPGSGASGRADRRGRDAGRRGGWREVDASGEETRAVAGMGVKLRVPLSVLSELC